MASNKNSKLKGKNKLAEMDDKDKALEMALSQITKAFGQGSVMKLGEKPSNVDEVDTISTGSIGLDIATGIGGVPKGRIIEVYGPEASGKTTLTLHLIAEAQKNNGRAAFIDAEHALDAQYAEKLGVNIDELLVSQPDTGEQALSICEVLVRSNALDIVVIDSVAALVPQVEIEGEMGASHVGLQARLMSQALRKLAGIAYKANTCVVFINQLREKVNTGYGMGSPETTTGGRALKFYSSMRLDVRRIEYVKSGEDVVGSRVKVKVAKNKMAPPFKLAFFDIIYGEGISQEGEVLESAVDAGIVNKSGSWYSYNEDRIGQGKDNVRKYLQKNVELFEEIKKKVVESELDIVDDEENDQLGEENIADILIDDDGVVIE